MSVFHRECVESLPEINHSSHPAHPLKLLQSHGAYEECSRCGEGFKYGYTCSICDDFKLDLRCAKGTGPLLVLENPSLHQHPLKRIRSKGTSKGFSYCKLCRKFISDGEICYHCDQCDLLVFHEECAEFFPEANHTSHPQHPLKLLRTDKAPDYADKKCLLCDMKFEYYSKNLHHCDVCNFSICTACMINPPPVDFESPTTHEHQLHLVPRLIDFTCNACGTLGHRSPYFCLQCNFMIHRECIDLPRVININRHDHRIFYTRRLGHGEWNCKVCRKKVDGFYGAYTCVKCPSFADHSLCATRNDVWDMIELEGMPEEEEIAPFEFAVIDANTIKHISHDHNLLRINKDGLGRMQPENIVCEACVVQILSEPSYSCKQCNFVLHDKCANLPLKKRHFSNSLPFTLHTDSRHEADPCSQHFTGFRYKTVRNEIMDVRYAAMSDTLEHGSHPHPLYFNSGGGNERCNGCGMLTSRLFRCDTDECYYKLELKCALLPEKVMRNRYDDHPLVLSFGDMNLEGDYWCEACETKVDPKKWFYTCNDDCGTILHISCVVGDFSYIMPDPHPKPRRFSRLNGMVESNTSI